ncbi:hypothetical protein BC828DRAFT_386233 [Blastocladiella britannica]|nr:hypothetical protein BC828DRAFT_386233 [Blastocladiella britannica]
MKYTYTQTHDQVAVTFTLPRDTPPSTRPVVTITSTTLTATVSGTPIIRGPLFAPIHASDSLWQIEAPQRTAPGVIAPRIVTVHLEKATAGVDWPVVVTESDDMDATSAYHLAQLLEAYDPPRALALYNKGADHGDVACMLKVAAFYEVGNENAAAVPVNQDINKANEWHRKAAHAPVDQYNAEYVAEACYILATAYSNGHGDLAQDLPVSMALYERAVTLARDELDRIGSQLSPLSAPGSPLGLSPVPKPTISQLAPGSAVKLRQLVQTCGFQAGLLHFEKQRYVEARAMWEYSGATGHAQSLFNLGVLYMNARGVDRDLERAVAYMRQAVAADATGKLSIPEGLEAAAEKVARGETTEQVFVESSSSKERRRGEKRRRREMAKKTTTDLQDALIVGTGLVIMGAGVWFAWKRWSSAAVL